MKAAQVAGTECGLNWLGYIMHYAPGPTLMVWPTISLAERNSKQRIAPMIESSPALRSLVQDKSVKNSNNNILSKEFPGGILIMVGANTATELANMPAKNLLLEEVDRFPLDVDNEGDPIALAEERTQTFPRCKIFENSSPNVKHKSRIERDFEKSDQRYYFVPCPHCDQYQRLVFGNLIWTKGKPETAHYVCESCGCMIDEHHKTRMLELGQWRATAHGDGLTAGFHLSSLYSPLGWRSWADIARKREEAGENQLLLKTFVNTFLGETWEERGDAPPWEPLYARRGTYKFDSVPLKTVMITAGVDVQKDRIEAEITGWAANRESWSINYHVFYGDPADEKVWENLTHLLCKNYAREDGSVFTITRMGLDTGFHTQEAYRFAKKHPRSRIMLIKGDAKGSIVIGQPSAVEINTRGVKQKSGLQLFPVNSGMLKQEFYGFLRLNKNEDGEFPAGYCHFPQYDENYFKQLTSEVLRTKIVRGISRRVWEKVFERNEALDCRMYATAAALLEGVGRLDANILQKRATAKTQIPQNTDVDKDSQPTPAPSAQPTPTQDKNSYMPKRKDWLRR